MKFLINIFLLLFITSSLIAQNWNVYYSPRFRQLNDIHIHNPDKIVIVGGYPNNDSITYMAYSSTAAQSWDVFTDIFPGKMINTVLFKNNIIGYCAGFNEAFYKTSDGGESWQAFDIGIDLNNKDVNNLFKSEYGVLYATGGLNSENGFLIKSTDGGNSWVSVFNWPENEIITAASPKHNTIVVASATGFFQISTDGAATWQNCEYPNLGFIPEFTAISFFDENNGFCSGGVRGQDSTALILKTTDGGNTWVIALNNIAPCLNDICMASDQVVYAVGDYGTVLKSEDGGTNWNIENIDGNPGEDLFAVSFLNTHIGAIAGRWGYVMVYNDGQTNLPEISTSEAREVTTNTAVLNAIVNPGFSDSEVSFLYGLDAITETEIACGTFTGGELQTVQKTLNNLEPDTKYYFRAKLTNSYGEYYGDIKYFYTGNPIPNWDFEHWNEINKDFPQNWYIKDLRFDKVVYPEFNAIRLIGTTSEGSHDDNAVLMNAIIDGDSIEGWHIPVDYISNGLTISSRPDSLFMTAKYEIETNDSAVVFVGLILDNHYVAENFYFITGSQQNFETLGFEIEYITDEIPERAAIVIMNSNPFDTLNTYSSFIELSQIRFSDNIPEIPNSDFSNWVSRTTYMPQDWYLDIKQVFDEDGTILNFTERTTDAAHNEYAIKLQNTITESDTTIARLLLKKWNQGLSIDKRFTTLMGQIKYLPEASDTAIISIVMYKAGEQIGWGSYRTSETIENWTEFSIELSYINPLAIPDSMNIIIEASQTPATGQSLLYIDKLSLDGDFIPVEKHNANDLTIHPNPATNQLYFSTIVNQIEIYNEMGQLVLSSYIPSNSICVEGLINGMYFVKIKEKENYIFRKIIKN